MNRSPAARDQVSASIRCSQKRSRDRLASAYQEPRESKVDRAEQTAASTPRSISDEPVASVTPRRPVGRVWLAITIAVLTAAPAILFFDPVDIIPRRGHVDARAPRHLYSIQ